MYWTPLTGQVEDQANINQVLDTTSHLDNVTQWAKKRTKMQGCCSQKE